MALNVIWFNYRSNDKIISTITLLGQSPVSEQRGPLREYTKNFLWETFDPTMDTVT